MEDIIHFSSTELHLAQNLFLTKIESDLPIFIFYPQYIFYILLHLNIYKKLKLHLSFIIHIKSFKCQTIFL